jgi:hypothetical protein
MTMKRTAVYILAALLLIAVGVLLLLQNLNVVSANLNQYVWAIIFAAGGVVFLIVYAASRLVNWWAVIPGIVLLALGGLVAFGNELGDWAGILFLASIGLAFIIIYLTNRAFWWALIPGGVLVTTAIMARLATFLREVELIGLLFLGLAVTFLVVALVPTPQGRMRWALWPAGATLVVGIILSLTSTSVLNWLWAVILIAAGGFLVYRALQKPKS